MKSLPTQRQGWVALVALTLLAQPLLAAAEPFSVQHLVRLKRVGAPQLSPDASHVVFALRSTDMDADKGRYDLWLARTDREETRQLTSHEAADTSPVWSKDGRYVYFLSSRGGSSQVWRIAVGGGEAQPVTDLPLDVGTFRLAADDGKLVVSTEVYLDCETLACTVERDAESDAAPTSGLAYDQLFMRHWDHWLSDKRSQLFALNLSDGVADDAEPVLLTGAVDADVPSRIWGGSEEYTVSADGATLYFAARLRDAKEPTSTNFDIYSAPMNGDGRTRNLTEDNLAWDTQPVLSPDGGSMAYLAMKRPGFEADRLHVMIRDLASGKTRELAPAWDRSPSSLTFSADGSSLLANATDVGNKTLWRIDLASGDTVKLTGPGYVSAVDAGPGVTVFASDSLGSPSEIYALKNGAAKPSQLTRLSQPQLADVELGDYEQFSFAGAGDETVYGWVVKPAGYRRGERYPVAFLIHGGPQGSFGNHFHYRWNPQTYAGQGLAAVFIDFHGSTGYGQAFTDSISGDWGGAPLTDLKLGLAAALERFDFLDGDKVCALGASYGGYMVNWIAGNWPDRFRCLVNHDGVFDTRMMYYATEELWFPEWENGGPQYAVAENYETFNPLNFVDRWQTPMLVIHGELDYRVPVTQGIAAFTAAQRQGVPSRFLYFPDENHWVLKPNNSIQWHDSVNEWLHRYLSSGKR